MSLKVGDSRYSVGGTDRSKKGPEVERYHQAVIDAFNATATIKDLRDVLKTPEGNYEKALNVLSEAGFDKEIIKDMVSLEDFKEIVKGSDAREMHNTVKSLPEYYDGLTLNAYITNKAEVLLETYSRGVGSDEMALKLVKISEAKESGDLKELNRLMNSLQDEDATVDTGLTEASVLTALKDLQIQADHELTQKLQSEEDAELARSLQDEDATVDTGLTEASVLTALKDLQIQADHELTQKLQSEENAELARSLQQQQADALGQASNRSSVIQGSRIHNSGVGVSQLSGSNSGEGSGSLLCGYIAAAGGMAVSGLKENSELRDNLYQSLNLSQSDKSECDKLLNRSQSKDLQLFQRFIGYKLYKKFQNSTALIEQVISRSQKSHIKAQLHHEYYAENNKANYTEEQYLSKMENPTFADLKDETAVDGIKESLRAERIELKQPRNINRQLISMVLIDLGFNIRFCQYNHSGFSNVERSDNEDRSLPTVTIAYSGPQGGHYEAVDFKKSKNSGHAPKIITSVSSPGKANDQSKESLRTSLQALKSLPSAEESGLSSNINKALYTRMLKQIDVMLADGLDSKNKHYGWQATPAPPFKKPARLGLDVDPKHMEEFYRNENVQKYLQVTYQMMDRFGPDNRGGTVQGENWRKDRARFDVSMRYSQKYCANPVQRHFVEDLLNKNFGTDF